MKKATHKYERVNCMECHAPCAWALPNEAHNQNVICNLCRMDEWNVLRWLGIVIPLEPTTIGDEERQLKRQKQSSNLDDFIREFNLPS